MPKRGFKLKEDGVEYELELGGKGPERDFIDLSLSTIARKEGKRDVPCWACKCIFGKPKDEREEPEIFLLWSFYETNKTILDEVELCEQLAKEYKKIVLDPCKADGIEALEWPAKVIYAHFFKGHVLVPKDEAYQDAKKLKIMQLSLEKALLRKDVATGKIEHHLHKLKEWREILRQKHVFLNV